jgi:hypothetical protein
LNQQGIQDGFDYDKNMKKVYNWTKDVEHMGHPNNYTKATPAGYKEDITWDDVDVHYTEEEKAKIRKEILEKGEKAAKKAVHEKETTDHPKKPDPPAKHKNVIKKCDTKGCDLSEEELKDKFDKKKKKLADA